jgi:hypothetical protein
VVRNLCLYRRRTVPDPTRLSAHTSSRQLKSHTCSAPPIASPPHRVRPCAAKPSAWRLCCCIRVASAAASSFA